VVERHWADGPDGTGAGPDGMARPWPPASSGNEPPMPPCTRCGAAFTAHLDGRCPPAQAAADRLTAQQWTAGDQGTGRPYPSWVPPVGGPPPAPAMAGPNPPRHNWVRRHPLLTGAIVLIALSTGIGVGILSASGQTNGGGNGNATACGVYWKLENAAYAYDVGAELAYWQDLRAAAPGITSSALSTAVADFDKDLGTGDTADAGTASTTIETACTALGYRDPRPEPGPSFIGPAFGQ
jgi:hypothetical protein